MKSYCTRNNGNCSICSLVNYGLDCANNPISTSRPKKSKRQRAMDYYTGHKGSATVTHVERNIESAYPGAYKELTGVQYGKLMSVANNSYHDGMAAGRANGEIWDYSSPTDWVAGIGPCEKVNDGYANRASIEVNGDIITITPLNSNPITYRRTD